MSDDIVGLVDSLELWANCDTAHNPDNRPMHLGTLSATALKTLAAERDAALRECAKWAREAGEAKGRLEASEIAGVVAGWRERAAAAEAQAATLAAENAWLREVEANYTMLIEQVREHLAVGDVGKAIVRLRDAPLVARAALSPVQPAGESGRG